MPQIELNDKFNTALDLIEKGSQSVFITGKAGTGKSTLLGLFRGRTKKKIAVLAPTGVAAINVSGQTIHSFFKFKPDIAVQKVKRLPPSNRSAEMYRALDAIVIDEISMVRADLLDCVDKFMRLNGRNKDLPFGGAQLIMFGDLYQLPPVVMSADRAIFKTHFSSPYFFSAKAMDGFGFEIVELEKIYRQSDERFISILNAIRNCGATDEHLAELNARLEPDFEPDPKDFFVYLTPTNKAADEINLRYLEKLPGKAKIFTGEIHGDFDRKYLPTEIELAVKPGAQVMMLNNDNLGRWVNGTVGRIKRIGKLEDMDVITVELEDGSETSVVRHTWEIYNFGFNKNKRAIESKIIGTFTQFPLMLAWAITIHKSQGKTFDKVVVDMGAGAFAHGQTYVALSRCRSLEGIVLKKPIKKGHIMIDWQIPKFLTGRQYAESDKALPLEEKLKLIKEAIKTKTSLKISYLKANDERTERTIRPRRSGNMEYLGKPFIGVSALDSKSGVERTFRVDRILKIEKV